MRLITARSCARRNSRGRGLPACGRGVTVPVSMKPEAETHQPAQARPHPCRTPRPDRSGWELKPNACIPGADRRGVGRGAESETKAERPRRNPCARSGSHPAQQRHHRGLARATSRRLMHELCGDRKRLRAAGRRFGRTIRRMWTSPISKHVAVQRCTGWCCAWRSAGRLSRRMASAWSGSPTTGWRGSDRTDDRDHRPVGTAMHKRS